MANQQESEMAGSIEGVKVALRAVQDRVLCEFGLPLQGFPNTASKRTQVTGAIVLGVIEALEEADKWNTETLKDKDKCIAALEQESDNYRKRIEHEIAGCDEQERVGMETGEEDKAQVWRCVRSVLKRCLLRNPDDAARGEGEGVSDVCDYCGSPGGTHNFGCHAKG